MDRRKLLDRNASRVHSIWWRAYSPVRSATRAVPTCGVAAEDWPGTDTAFSVATATGILRPFESEEQQISNLTAAEQPPIPKRKLEERKFQLSSKKITIDVAHATYRPFSVPKGGHTGRDVSARIRGLRCEEAA